MPKVKLLSKKSMRMFINKKNWLKSTTSCQKNTMAKERWYLTLNDSSPRYQVSIHCNHFKSEKFKCMWENRQTWTLLAICPCFLGKYSHVHRNSDICWERLELLHHCCHSTSEACSGLTSEVNSYSRAPPPQRDTYKCQGGTWTRPTNPSPVTI